MHIDVKNAFQTLSRRAMLDQASRHVPHLLPLICQFYLDDSDLVISGDDGECEVLRSCSGSQQGCTFGQMLFCLAIHPALQDAAALCSNVVVRGIADDIHLAGPPDAVHATFCLIKNEFRKLNLELSYGPKKTCAYSPSWGVSDSAAAAAALAACPLPPEVLRLPEGMHTLGAFIGSDTFVAREARAAVNADRPESILQAAAALKELAAGPVRNARDIAGLLLRACVPPKVTLLCRVVRPDLFRPAAEDADAICEDAFCSIWSTSPGIFSAQPGTTDWLAGIRVHQPLSSELHGCGIRSAVVTSQSAYLASWRTVAPAVATSSPAAAAALASMDGQAAPPALRALAAARRSLPALPALARTAMDTSPVTTPAPPHLQRMLTHAVEQNIATHALQQASLNQKDVAHLNSCDGRWLRAARVPWQQLGNGEAAACMQRYLRQPVDALAGLRFGPDQTRIDELGDSIQSQYKAKGDGEWTDWHNELRDKLATYGKQANVPITFERRSSDANGKKPGDIVCSRAHCWPPALDKVLCIDVTNVSATCKDHAPQAALERGGAAADAVKTKHTKYRRDIPQHWFFLPLAFEADGYVSPAIDALLWGWAKQWAERSNRCHADARRTKEFWLDNLALEHARCRGRCILDRAAACHRAAHPQLRPLHVSDVDQASHAPPPNAT